MANNWRFFQDTGLVGGTANLANKVFYVDSYNGNDTNVGSNVAPFKTIQKAIDSMTGAAASGADIIVAGYFKEGVFVGIKTYGSIIAEGDVEIDGSVSNGFYPFVQGVLLNATYFNGFKSGRNYGKLRFNNFIDSIIVGSTISSSNGMMYNTVFYNCLKISGNGFWISTIQKCTFINSILGGGALLRFYGGNVWEKNTFINSTLQSGFLGAGNVFRSNFFDTTSIVNFNSYIGENPDIWDFNCIIGSFTAKIRAGGSNYNNIEAYKAAYPTKAVNDLPSTTVPLFNLGNAEDFTLQETSPLKKAAHDKKHIGAYNVAKFLDTSDGGLFTYVDTVATVGEVKLDNSPLGTITSTAGIELFPKKRLLERISLPLAEINRAIGEVIGSNLAAANKPYLSDVEIQYSIDNITYNGTWLRVPIGTQPFHDTTNNVGNDDPLFSIGTAVGITCRYIKLRITLRDNETLI